MKIFNLFEHEQSLKSLQDVKSLTPRLVQTVQKVYDDWDENEDEYAGGGICHLIADALADALNGVGIDASTVSAEIGDQHVWTVFKVAEGVYTLDVSPYTYETGGGYTWKKIQGVQFDSHDISLDRISPIPDEFDKYIDQ